MEEAEALYFKNCNSTDFKLLYDIYIRSYKEHYAHIWDDQGKAYLERYYNKTAFEASLNKSSNHYFLIYLDLEPVGLFKLTERELENHNADDCLEINKVYILNVATGKGIGSKVLSFIKDMAIAQDRNILWVNVMENSKAKNFYKRNGFELVKQTTLNFPYMKKGLNVLSSYKKTIQNFK
jgi:GNAT superfamily N-acetyltransferase